MVIYHDDHGRFSFFRKLLVGTYYLFLSSFLSQIEYASIVLPETSLNDTGFERIQSS